MELCVQIHRLVSLQSQVPQIRIPSLKYKTQEHPIRRFAVVVRRQHANGQPKRLHQVGIADFPASASLFKAYFELGAFGLTVNRRHASNMKAFCVHDRNAVGDRQDATDVLVIGGGKRISASWWRKVARRLV